MVCPAICERQELPVHKNKILNGFVMVISLDKLL